MATQAQPQFQQEVVHWQQQLLRIQHQYRDRIEKELPVVAVERVAGNYILESERFPFSPVLFREILLHLAPLLREYSSQPVDFVPLLSRLDDDLLNQLANAVQSSPEQDFPNALAMAVREVRLHRKANLPEDVLELLLQTSFVPFFSAFSRQQNIPSKWQRGWCPVCGQFPINGCNIAEDNRRVLGCWLCEANWSYMRLACPVCSCLDAGKLKLLAVTEQRNHRLQICGECNHYLKITDNWPQDKPFDPMGENAATAYLDILAQQQGFRPASRALWNNLS